MLCYWLEQELCLASLTNVHLVPQRSEQRVKIKTEEKKAVKNLCLKRTVHLKYVCNNVDGRRRCRADKLWNNFNNDKTKRRHHLMGQPPNWKQSKTKYSVSRPGHLSPSTVVYSSFYIQSSSMSLKTGGAYRCWSLALTYQPRTILMTLGPAWLTTVSIFWL